MLLFKRYKNIIVLGTVSFFTPFAVSSGFQIWDQNASDTANCHAGSASEANNASTAFYNPAGMSYLDKQHISLGFSQLVPRVKFKGTVGVSSGNVQPDDFNSFNTKFSPANSRRSVIVPNIYYTVPVDDNWHAGFGINAPFGSTLKYDKHSWVRYTGVETNIQVVNILSALSLRVSPSLSVGLGLDLQGMSETLKTNINAVGGNAPSESYSVNRVNSLAPGFHGGVLYQLFPRTRLGISYHSPVKHKLRGISKFTGPLVASLISVDSIKTHKIRTNVVLPSTTTVSLFHQLNQWDLLGSLSYTRWSRIKNFKFSNLTGIDIGSNLSKHLTIIAPTSLHDTWNLALGTHYHINKEIYLQFGLGFDQSPVRLTGRSTRFPDADRYAVSAGLHYQVNSAFNVDIGWRYIIIKKGKIKVMQQNGGMTTNTIGHSSGYINTAGVQLSYKF